MKKIVVLLICVVSIFSMCLTADAKEPDKSTAKVYFNSSDGIISGYRIDGKDYYRIRDALHQFNIYQSEKLNIRWNSAEERIETYYDENFIDITTPEALGKGPSFRVYEIKQTNPWGYEDVYWATEDTETGERNAYVKRDPYIYNRDRIYRPTEYPVNLFTIDGEAISTKRYDINGEYFYYIGDLAEMADWEYFYSDESDSIYLTNALMDYYNIHFESGDWSLSAYNECGLKAWAHTLYMYITDNKDGTFSTFDGGENEYGNLKKLSVYTYNKSDFKPIDQKLIPLELDYFCGFYSGEKYNFIAFGAHNAEEIPDKEIIRVVKYDKQYNRISSLSLTTEECYAIDICDAGVMRMAENGNELVIHTSRLRMLTEDGLNHQSQLSIVINTDDMSLKNYTGPFQSNHVSHSFNQFVEYDGDDIVYADHGDAYPRAIVINTPTKVKNIYEMPGIIGDNYTGVYLGGFHVSSSKYITSFNSADFTNGIITDTNTGRWINRNAYFAVCDKKTDKVKVVPLTDFFGTKKHASAPHLVEISNDRYVLLWNEYEYIDKLGYFQFRSSKYVEINGKGEFITDVRSSDKELSADMDMKYMDNAVYWFEDLKLGRIFYRIHLDPSVENPIKVIYDGKKIEFDQPPVLEGGRTLVPLRAIFEKIGADVQWNSETQTVTATKDDTAVSLTINNTTAHKNGKDIVLDVPAKIIGGRTLVPVRFISDCFGVDVQWEQETRTVVLTSK